MKIQKDHGVLEPVSLIGIRGFKGENQRKIYDDAIFLITPNWCTGFTANCDPGAFRSGIATLTEGVWLYKKGIHGLSRPKDKQYPALVQAMPFTVSRDGGVYETDFLGINCHRGNLYSVSSEGCQTIHPDQWGEFWDLIEKEVKLVIPYNLINRETYLKYSAAS